ncbi:hypothetical protein ABL78_6284 [Leptomonas seymouri]|uniref:Uncharacterized protein n=1 Tax=Leptomonas seymouri TaxID=5684 RepID=A0A0N1IIE3_LEPSE|nr:hypothetical protein ABL78_6284 [Leptomonas seymouri]|eukprot:KPI84668.1 hypothetical protein ABL78_6284 [Leptomonas seymouri]
MMSTIRRYSLAKPPPTQGELDGRETVDEAEILEVQALQAEHDGNGARSIQLMERALQIRCFIVNQLREKWASAPDTVAPPFAASNASRRMSTASVVPMNKDDLLHEHQKQCSDLYDAAERLVVCCNACGVEHFKKDAFDEAIPLLEYATQLTDEEAYPLCEVEERRRHLRGVTLNNLGCMERRRGHFSEALNYMKASMEMTGIESPAAYMNLSAILIQLRLNDEAVRMAERSIALLSQIPEDSTLLAVAHHNLAMALEPVDPQRCVEEYEQAYHISCSTFGKDNSTSQLIQHSWQRFERTRAPALSPGGRFVVPLNSRGDRGSPTIPHTAPASRDGGLRTTTTPPPADAAEIFPHPFLMTSTVPQQPRSPGQPPKMPPVPTRPSRPSPRRAAHESAPAKTACRPSPVPAANRSSSPSTPPPRSAAAASLPPARSGGGAYTDRRTNTTLVPSPPSRSRAAAPPAASRRFSPSRPADSSPSRAVTSQRRLSDCNNNSNSNSNNNNNNSSSANVRRKKVGNRLSPLKTNIATTTRTTTTTTTTSSNFNTSGTQRKPSRVPRRPAEKNTKNAVYTPSPPPRVLPPLRTAETTEKAAAPKKTPQPSNAAVRHTSVSQHQAPAAASMEENPLVFLQNRLEVLLQDEEELEQKYVQANIIQRYYRGYRARMRVAELRGLRARDLRIAELRQNMASRQIQQAYRRHRRQRRYPFGAGQWNRSAGGRRSAQHHAATQLQRVARGWLARRRYVQLRQFARDSPAAAAKIQRWYRRIHAQRRHAALLAEKAQYEAEMQEQEQRQYAATRIQGQWRAYASRKAHETDLRNRMMARAAEVARLRVKSAILIQSMWRGSQARKMYRSSFSRSLQLRAARLEYERRRQAAVKLQSFGRMIITRHQSLPLLTEARLRAAKEINTRTREGRAAQVIQCAYRSHSARRLYAEKKAAHDAQLRRNLAQVQALALQRVGRGYDARKFIAAEMSALQDEAERYQRRLRALELGDAAAAREAHQKTQQLLSRLELTESERRNAASMAEQKERHMLQHHCEIAAQNVAAEEKEHQCRRAAAILTLGKFLRIVKARAQRSLFQRARDAYLDQLEAAEKTTQEDASARVVTAFMRSVGPRNAVRSRADAVKTYNDARVLQEMGSAEQQREGAAVSDAEMRGMAETADEAREAPQRSNMRRPLTAQQIAGERAELDRLTVSENRVCQDEVIDAAEGGISDKATSCSTEEELLTRQKAIWQAEEMARKKRRQQQEALHKAMFDYKQQRIAAAQREADLVPYTMERVRLQRQAATGAAPSGAKALRDTPDGASAPNIHRQQRLARECDAAHTILRYYSGYKARQYLAALQGLRDEYLAIQQDMELHDGPVLVDDRLREIRAQNLQMVAGHQKAMLFMPQQAKPAAVSSGSTASVQSDSLDDTARIAEKKQQQTPHQNARAASLNQCGVDPADEHSGARVPQEADEAFTGEAPAEVLEPQRPSTRRPRTAQQIAEERAELDRLTAAENIESQKEFECTAEEREKQNCCQLSSSQLERGADNVSSSDAASSSATPVVRERYRPTSAEARACLKGFAKIIRDRKELRLLQAIRDAYLDEEDASDGGSTAEDTPTCASGVAEARAAEEDADARVPQETTEVLEPQRPSTRRPRTAQQIAEERQKLDALFQAHLHDLEEEMAVEELLHTAALAIQCAYRGHRARLRAAMAIVQRDLYLLELQAQTDSDAAEGEEEPSSRGSVPAEEAEPPLNSQQALLAESEESDAALPNSLPESGMNSSAEVMEVNEEDDVLWKHRQR